MEHAQYLQEWPYAGAATRKLVQPYWRHGAQWRVHGCAADFGRPPDDCQRVDAEQQSSKLAGLYLEPPFVISFFFQAAFVSGGHLQGNTSDNCDSSCVRCEIRSQLQPYLLLLTISVCYESFLALVSLILVIVET